MKTPFRIITITILSLTFTAQLSAQSSSENIEFQPIRVNEELFRESQEHFRLILEKSQVRTPDVGIHIRAERIDPRLELSRPTIRALQDKAGISNSSTYRQTRGFEVAAMAFDFDAEIPDYNMFEEQYLSFLFSPSSISDEEKATLTELSQEMAESLEPDFVNRMNASAWFLNNADQFLFLNTDETLPRHDQYQVELNAKKFTEAFATSGLTANQKITVLQRMINSAPDMIERAEMTQGFLEALAALKDEEKKVASVIEDVRSILSQAGTTVGTFDFTFTTSDGVQVSRSYEMREDGVSRISDDGEKKDLINLRQK